MKRVDKLGPIFLSFALIIASKSAAQQQTSGQQKTDTHQTEQGSQADDQRDFEGTIVKTKIGATFLLMDYQHHTAYFLDDPDIERMKRFDGKKVVVTGTLDPLSNTIMVSTIRSSG